MYKMFIVSMNWFTNISGDDAKERKTVEAQWCCKLKSVLENIKFKSHRMVYFPVKISVPNICRASARTSISYCPKHSLLKTILFYLKESNVLLILGLYV